MLLNFYNILMPTSQCKRFSKEKFAVSGFLNMIYGNAMFYQSMAAVLFQRQHVLKFGGGA